MNCELRQTIRTAIDQHRRDQLFTTDANGRVILKPQHRYSPLAGAFVAGIVHGSWGYRHHKCRCEACRDGELERNKRHRGKRRERTL